MRRTGLGRHRRIRDSAGDPLDGLVNLFDIGIVLAVAFLIAGLSVTLSQSARRPQQHSPTAQRIPSLPSPAQAPSVSGRGRAVGTVYRLSNGQLVYVQAPAASRVTPQR
jgi:hypothetical protein